MFNYMCTHASFLGFVTRVYVCVVVSTVIRSNLLRIYGCVRAREHVRMNEHEDAHVVMFARPSSCNKIAIELEIQVRQVFLAYFKVLGTCSASSMA